ncbi:MAG: zinc ribbon domain-containing protein [Burkholderiales bacterium]|nr:zinc ribbon domain-containing protein [Burkholderiales bacterium]
MPIYAYRCSNCGHAQDVLQRMSDPVLSVCPACGQPTYVKQVTAAGFQLKGSGWYVTDFRGDKKTGKSADAGDGEKGGAKDGGAAAPAGDKGGDAPAGGDAKAEAKNGESGKKADAAPAAAPSPAPAAAPAAPATPGKTGT